MRIPVQDRGVEHGRQEVVRRADRVYVSSEVKVEILHRHHLGQAATRRTPLHSEHGTERWLSQAGDWPLADRAQPLRKTHERRRVTLAGRRRRHPGHAHELAVRPLLEPVDNRQRDLRLVATEGGLLER